jgi:hypothetical protein
MGRPRFHPIRTTLTAIIVAGAMILTIAASVSATPWQKSWGDYDGHDQWHDASWWLQNRHNWVTVHHPEWTENYADTFGRIGDYDRRHMWHYGDGGRPTAGYPGDSPPPPVPAESEYREAIHGEISTRGITGQHQLSSAKSGGRYSPFC